MIKLPEGKTFTEHELYFKERTGNDFTFFYKKYYPKLIYYTSKMCGDVQKAQDITTDSFMTAFEKIDKYDKDKSQFSTWLFTIARNILLQDIKVSKKTISLDVEYDEDGSSLKDFIKEDDPVDITLQDVIQKKAQIMMDQIQSLKDPYKSVIEMREIKKMSYRDISLELNRNLSTIKSQIRNGRIILINQTKSRFEKIDSDR